MRPSTLLRVAACLVLVLPAGCEETPPGGGDAGPDAGLDAAPPVDAAPPEDAAVPEAGPPPEGVPFEYCDQPFFRLHIGGETEELYGYSLSGSWLAYNRTPSGGSLVFDLYVMDLDRCLEYQLTSGSRATAAYVHGSQIVWSENRERSPPPDYHCMDIYRYDLERWQEEQLTDHPLCEWNPETNGRYIAYSRSTAQDGGSPRDYLLWDLVADTEFQFAEPGAQAGYYDLSDLWLAWSGYTQLATSVGKDVFVRDLQTGEGTHLETSTGYYCYNVRLDGEYLTYACSEYWTQFPYHLFLHHLPTGEELHLDGGQAEVDGISHGAIHEGIVAWCTTKHVANHDILQPVYDVELYDIRTGIYRRLTTAHSLLRVVDIQVPWVTFSYYVGPDVRHYYVGHLGRLGVLDANGRLLEGDGVLDPPP